MIANDQQLHTTRDRIAWFQNQVAQLRKTETNPVNYRAAVSGFLAEIDRMQLEVREYFSFLPDGESRNGLTRKPPDPERNQRDRFGAGVSPAVRPRRHPAAPGSHGSGPAGTTSVASPRSPSRAATSGSAATARVSTSSPPRAYCQDPGGLAGRRAEIVELIVERRGQGRAAVNADPQAERTRRLVLGRAGPAIPAPSGPPPSRR